MLRKQNELFRIKEIIGLFKHRGYYMYHFLRIQKCCSIPHTVSSELKNTQLLFTQKAFSLLVFVKDMQCVSYEAKLNLCIT
jgi:hypothetical protein